ncbi:MAG: glucose/galactose MFS transporter, partial [Steroidobacteraceae bacterium]
MAVQFGGDPSLTQDGSAPRQSYTAALTVLTSVFFIWGFATVLNDTLVPHFKSAFGLDYTQSLLVQFVFYLGYLIMGLPAAKVLERTGYK